MSEPVESELTASPDPSHFSRVLLSPHRRVLVELRQAVVDLVPGGFEVDHHVELRTDAWVFGQRAGLHDWDKVR